jgi:hypothetical protein
VKHFRKEFEYHIEHKNGGCMNSPLLTTFAWWGRPVGSHDMPLIEIDGKQVEVAAGATVMDAAHQAGHLHPAFLLPQETVHRRQLPHVPGGSGKGAQAPAGLRHAGHRRHEGA